MKTPDDKHLGSFRIMSVPLATKVDRVIAAARAVDRRFELINPENGRISFTASFEEWLELRAALKDLDTP